MLTSINIGFTSCKDDTKSEKQILEATEKELPQNHFQKLSSNRENLNISVLLDLSDRINPEKYPSPSMEFYLRDIGYLKSVARSFETHLINKKLITINDNLQVYIDPEPSDKTLNEKLQILKVSFNKNNVTKKGILETSIKYDSISDLIYKAAIKDDHYVGSDTWRFFKNKVNDYCIEEGYRNILILLTDGYIYHKNTKIMDENRTTYLTPQYIKHFGLNSSKWQEKFSQQDFGFISNNENLSDLEVLILGINPDIKNPHEEDVIRAYWSKWLEEMNVKYYEIKQADLPSNMDKIIREFILTE